VLWRAEAHAADCPPEERLRHRFAAGGGVAATYFNGGQDGHFHEEVPRGSAQLGYAYSPERGLEGGADVVVFNGPVILAGGTLRGYVPIGARDIVELGIGAHFGFHLVRYGSAPTTWTGWGAWAGPDVRVWATERFGFQLAGQAFVGWGSTSLDGNRNEYLQEKSAFIGLGGAFSVLLKN
jgi:hypothetical protein